MDSMIRIVAVGLMLLYIGIAVYYICTRKTIGKSLIYSACFIAGGFMAVPLAEAIASLVCYAIIVVLVLAFIGAVFS